MRGNEVNEAFFGFAGVYGDRCYAFKNSSARKGFPYLGATSQPKMLRYIPCFRYLEKAAIPANFIEALQIEPGVTYANPETDDLRLDVVTPSGKTLPIDDPVLLEMLCEGLQGENNLELVKSDRALTDCRPVSLISLQTIRQIETELNIPIDKRRFRSNIYCNLESDSGFSEDDLVGKKLRIGSKAIIMVLEHDPRCKMISLDPETGEHNPEILRKVAQEHSTCAGIYCAVLVEGIVAKGDLIEMLD